MTSPERMLTTHPLLDRETRNLMNTKCPEFSSHRRQLLQRGFELPAARPGMQALNIEVMLRRFGYRDSDVNSPELQQLLALVGEPSAQQLLDIRENKVNSFPERKTDDARSIALYAYIDQRISDLSQPSKAGESARLPNRVSPDAL